MRALAAIANRRSASVLSPLSQKAPTPALRLEAVAAPARWPNPAAAEVLVDYLEAEGASLRAAAQAALAKANPESTFHDRAVRPRRGQGLERARGARHRACRPATPTSPRCTSISSPAMPTPKVRAAACRRSATLKVPGTDARLVSALAHADPVVRMAGAPRPRRAEARRRRGGARACLRGVGR